MRHVPPQKRMNGFENKVYNFIKKERMLEQADAVVVGFSGGADSTALMTVLYELRRLLGVEPVAVHINHGIRQEAAEDETFAGNYCKERGIRFISVQEDIPSLSKKWNMTEEEAGRKVRYEAFNKAVTDLAGEGKKAVIAVAHHEDDVAETLLMNLLRGSGLRGAGAIRPVRDNVIRPLLCVTRREIEGYLQEKGIGYCTDSTNAENIHTRNKIRNEVMPYLIKNINDEGAEHLFRAATDFARADEYIRGQASELFSRIVTITGGKEVSFNVTEFGLQPGIIREYLILMCFEALVTARKDITRAHVEAVLELTDTTDGGGCLNLPYDILAERNYNEFRMFVQNSGKREKSETSVETRFDVLSLLKDKNSQKININLPGLGVAEIEILEYNGKTPYPTASYTKWFDYDRIQTAVFRTREPEDEIILDKGDAFYSKKLSKYMTDEKIPAAVRDSLPILAEGNSIIWVPGYRYGSKYKVSSNTKKILAINIINGGNNNG